MGDNVAAKDISTELFDIDFHKYIKEDGEDNESHFIIEKTHDYIGGGASGNAKTVRRHNREFKMKSGNSRFFKCRDESVNDL